MLEFLHWVEYCKDMYAMNYEPSDIRSKIKFVQFLDKLSELTAGLQGPPGRPGRVSNT